LRGKRVVGAGFERLADYSSDADLAKWIIEHLNK
jgi:hypothetical protein